MAAKSFTIREKVLVLWGVLILAAITAIVVIAAALSASEAVKGVGVVVVTLAALGGVE